MFKKGQVLLSARTDRFFIVEDWPFAFPVRNGSVLPNLFRVGHRQFKLIGNNYQAKPISSR